MADSVDQCPGANDSLMAVRYKDGDSDGYVVASSAAVCPNDSTYTIAASTLTTYQLAHLDTGVTGSAVGDDAVAASSYSSVTYTEATLGEDFDGDSTAGETNYSIYVISTPTHWLQFARGCSNGTNTTCSHAAMIVANLNFASLDGTTGDATSGDGKYTSISAADVLAAGGVSSTYYFRKVVDGRSSTISNFNVDLSASAGVNKGCGTNTVCDKVGGIVGECFYCVIKNLTFQGNVTGGTNVGGILGYSNQPTSHPALHFSGVVTGTGNKVGGLAGETLGTVVFTNASVAGTVTGSSTEVGGFVGFAYRGVQVTKSYNTANVTGTDKVGGIVGRMADDPGQTSYVTESYNTGSIVGTTFVGGIVGEMRHGSKIEDCYNLGQVKGAQAYTGGIVGYQIVGTSARNYNAGQVLNSGGYQADGVVGYLSTSTATNIYYLTGKTDSDGDLDVDGNDTNTDGASATVLTLTQMKSSASFSGFNFTTIWNISAGSSYPYLRNNVPTTLPGI